MPAKKEKRKSLLPILLTIAGILLVILIAIIGFYLGYQKGQTVSRVFEINAVNNIDDKAKEADFMVFWEAWDTLKGLHINAEDVDPKSFLYSAISGLAAAFDDPYTTFFPPEEAKKFQEDVNGRFFGIGAEIGTHESGLPIVISPLKNSPAERAGLKPKDLILAVDGISTEDKTVDEVVTHIRGERGVAVVLTVLSEGGEGEKDVSIIRDEIKVPTLEYELVANEAFAHISLFSFNENALGAFEAALQNVGDDKVSGIILDLRSNPGGFLEVATRLSGWFLERGQTVVTERFKVGKDREFKARGTGEFKDFPLVVLINEGSASASEILAGALRDINDTSLIGKTSFGKGSVQELVYLSDRSSLKITIAEWEMPGGEILSSDGLVPDYEVELDQDEFEAGSDTQLNKAIEVLTGLVK